MTLQFNPNKPSVTKVYIWATYIPGRRPEFKLHSQRGHALTAFYDRENAILYNWVDDHWVEVFRMENYYDIDHCQICEKPFEVYDGAWSKYNKFRRTGRKWVDLKTDKPKLLRVCRECKNG